MAGEAKTNQFMLSTATVMLGAQADLMNLDKSNSIGLVKNFTIQSQPGYTELTQGVKNSLVHSEMTSNDVSATMEVFEFTAANIAYGLGQEGANFAPATVTSLVDTEAAAGQNVVNVTATEGANFTPGKWVKLGTGDDLVIAQIDSIATDAITMVDALSAVVPAGSTIEEMNVVGVGSKVNQPFLSAKVAGQLADGTDIVVMLPKVRVTQGFALAFSTENYGNMPYQFSLYDLTNSDPYFAQFGNLGQAAIFKQ